MQATMMQWLALGSLSNNQEISVSSCNVIKLFVLKHLATQTPAESEWGVPEQVVTKYSCACRRLWVDSLVLHCCGVTVQCDQDSDYIIISLELSSPSSGDMVLPNHQLST